MGGDNEVVVATPEVEGDSFKELAEEVDNKVMATNMIAGVAVEVREENGRVVIEPVRAPIYTLDELLAGMAPETFPGDEGLGPAVGQDVR